jgi:SRSO17 transposase
MAARRSRADQVLAVQPSRTHPEANSGASAKLRWRIEHDYREVKTGLGLDHYEGRTWTGWHHHVTLVSAAHTFLTLQRLDPKPVRRNDPLRRTPTPAAPARLPDRHLPNLPNPLPATDTQTPPKIMTKHY